MLPDHPQSSDGRTWRDAGALFDALGVDTAQGRQYNVDPDGRFPINTELDRLSDHSADELNPRGEEVTSREMGPHKVAQYSSIRRQNFERPRCSEYDGPSK